MNVNPYPVEPRTFGANTCRPAATRDWIRMNAGRSWLSGAAVQQHHGWQPAGQIGSVQTVQVYAFRGRVGQVVGRASRAAAPAPAGRRPDAAAHRCGRVRRPDRPGRRGKDSWAQRVRTTPGSRTVRPPARTSPATPADRCRSEYDEPPTRSLISMVLRPSPTFQTSIALRPPSRMAKADLMSAPVLITLAVRDRGRAGRVRQDDASCTMGRR